MSRERVLRAMAAESVDVLLLGREGNARYVSGAHRLFLAGERAFAPGCVVVRETGAVHLLSATDFGVPQELKHSHLYAPSWNPVTLIGRVAAVPGVASAAQVGVDGLTPLFEALLASALPRADLVDGESLMRAVRRVKSPEEVALIRAATPVTGLASAPAGPVPFRRSDERPGAAVPGAAGPPDPPSRAALVPGLPALLEPRARVADRSELDLLFAELGRTLDDPLARGGGA